MTIKGKDLIERISDKEYSEDLIKELEKYEVKRPKSVWKLKNGDVIWVTYYVYTKSEYDSREIKWFDLEVDYYRRENGEIHLTEERAELHARVLNTELAIKKWKRENDKVELNWNNDRQNKHHLAYNHQYREIIVNLLRSLKHPNTIYFSSESKAERCVNDIGKEKIIEWLKWEDNDQ